MTLPRAIAGLAAAGALHELTRPASFAESAPKPVTPAHDPVLKSVAARMPCGVARLDPDAHGFPVRADGLGVNLVLEYKIQRASLAAQFGSLLEQPKISNACAIEWCELWLDAWQRAAALDAKRYSLRTPEALFPVTDWRDRTALTSTEKSLGSELTNLGIKLERVKTMRFLATLQPADELSRFDAISKALLSFAVTMDTTGTVGGDVELSLGKELADSARNLAEKGAQTAGDTLAFSIEKVIAPIVGTTLAASLTVIGSAIGPYLIVGGVGYYVWRRA